MGPVIWLATVGAGICVFTRLRGAEPFVEADACSGALRASQRGQLPCFIRRSWSSRLAFRLQKMGVINGLVEPNIWPLRAGVYARLDERVLEILNGLEGIPDSFDRKPDTIDR